MMTFIPEIEAELQELSDREWDRQTQEWAREQTAKLKARDIKAIYTDGSGKGGDCGYGVSILFPSGKTYEIGGFEKNSTNQRAELLAVIAALEFIQNHPNRDNIEIFSDSAYVVNGYSRWLEGWVKNNWQTADKKPVENRDLWERLETLRGAKLSHLKGHSDRSGQDGRDRRQANYAKYGDLADQHNRGNCRADEIAGWARKNGEFQREGGYLSDVWNPPNGSVSIVKARSTDSEAFNFQDRILKRAISEAMLSESVLDANIRFFDLEQTHERLNWKISRHAGYRLIPFNESFGFINEDDSSFQHQLDIFRVAEDDKKPIKYESVKGKGAQIFMPSVPVDIRRKMSEKFGVEVPLTGSFWHWFQTSPNAKKLPLIITEGGWKCLSILSLGIPAISLYGCSAGFETRESKYDKRRLCVDLDELVRGKRQVTIAFDEDEKLSTRRKVNANTRILGEAIAAKASVKVASWSGAKGADDFIQLYGGLAFESVLKEAIDFKAWKSCESIAYSLEILKRSAYLKADITANQRWVSDCGFPIVKMGQGVFASSAMHTGKSTWFASVIEELRKIYPDLLVELIGSRNNLLRQSAGKIEAIHIADLDNAGGDFIRAQMDATERLAYCIDSLPRRFDRLIRAAQSGQFFLLALDELDALLTHLLNSTTIGAQRRMQIICQFKTLLDLAAKGHGAIIGGEANLSGLSIDSIRQLTGGKLEMIICRNDYLPPQWEVIDHSQAGAAANKQGAIAKTRQLLKEGKRVLLMTTSQEAAEQFEVLFGGKFKTQRIDSKTSTDPEVRELIKHPDRELPKREIVLLIATPTIENGVSIDEHYFDAIVEYGSGGEPRQLHQMLGRNRPPVPRYLFVCATGAQTRKGLNADTLIQKWDANVKNAIESHKLNSETQIEAIEIAKTLAAEFQVRTEAGSNTLRSTLIELLKQDGHKVKTVPFIVPPGIDKEIKEAKEILADQFVKLWSGLDDSLITCKQARQMLKQELTYSDHLLAQKALERDKFGQLVDLEDWIRKYWAQGNASRSNRKSIRNAANYVYPEIARELDQQELQRQIESTGTIWQPSYASREAVIELLKKLQFDQILNLPEGTVLHAESGVVRFVALQALKHSIEVKEVLGLTVGGKSSPISFVNDVLARRLGAEIQQTRITLENKESPKRHNDYSLGQFRYSLSSKTAETPTLQEAQIEDSESRKRDKGETRKRRPKGEGRGKQAKAYRIVNFPYRAEMIEAIKAAHEAAKAEPEQEISANEVPGQVIDVDGEALTVISATQKQIRLTIDPELPIEYAIVLSRQELKTVKHKQECENIPIAS
ncbi:MAG: DUF3854 domain-containing protein [Phormidium tanganyikae FI6-MK23]|jgi:ribonuclease HI|nr:DUF3854 domain-containing protein [Phormidium tanganyikae FI6-MK23]